MNRILVFNFDLTGTLHITIIGNKTTFKSKTKFEIFPTECNIYIIIIIITLCRSIQDFALDLKFVLFAT